MILLQLNSIIHGFCCCCRRCCSNFIDHWRWSFAFHRFISMFMSCFGRFIRSNVCLQWCACLRLNFETWKLHANVYIRRRSQIESTIAHKWKSHWLFDGVKWKWERRSHTLIHWAATLARLWCVHRVYTPFNKLLHELSSMCVYVCSSNDWVTHQRNCTHIDIWIAFERSTSTHKFILREESERDWAIEKAWKTKTSTTTAAEAAATLSK